MELSFLQSDVALAGLAVTVVVEILKLKIIPLKFANEHPVPVMLVLSLIGSMSVVGFSSITWENLFSTFVQVAIVSALTYNQILKRWDELRQSETNS